MKLKTFVYVGVIGTLVIAFNAGCEAKSETSLKPEATAKQAVVQEVEIPEKYYGVQWGKHDNEWVFSDDWVQPEELTFNESMAILNTCKKGKDSNTQANKETVQSCLKDEFSSKIAK